MEDLVRWYGQQLDTDERIARAAASLSGVVTRTGEQWRVSGSHADDGGTYWSITTASPDLDRITPVEMVGSGMSGGGAHTEEVAAHIAAHDPARVLREIDSKRRIIEQYVRAAQAVNDLSATRDRLSAAGKDTLMTGLDLESAIHRRDTLRGVLRLVALPYADRPGYQESWRP